MPLVSITVAAGQPIYLPKNAIIKALDVPDDASVESECFDLDGIPGFNCYAVNICQSGDGGNTDNYEDIRYMGMIIDGEKIPFASYVQINTNDEPHDEQIEDGMEAIIDQMMLTSYGVQGMFRELARCNARDQADDRGTCIVLTFKTLEPIGQDMRFYAEMHPIGESDPDTFEEIHFPVFLASDLTDIFNVATCGCGV